MGKWRRVCGVLNNFLDTYTSRYTDYRGYWLFGFIVAELTELRIDLLAAEAADVSHPRALMSQLAAAKFQDQLLKWQIDRAQLTAAWLRVDRHPDDVLGHVNWHPCTGFQISFMAEALTSNGQHCKRSRMVWVAPHNPLVELQSARGL